MSQYHIILECAKINDPHLQHLRNLLEGALFKELGECQLAIKVTK